jgi:hypothetical protein
VSAPTGPSDDEAYWRRPDDGAPAGPAPAPGPPPGDRQPPPPAYTGPPPSAPPPAGWRPPFVAEPVPPRALPPQDTAALDASERSARTVTYGIGMVAAALMVVMVCLLCSRLLF